MFNLDHLSIDQDLPAFVAMLKDDEKQLAKDALERKSPGASKFVVEHDDRQSKLVSHEKKSPGLSKYEEYENRPMKPLSSSKKLPKTMMHHGPKPRTAFSPERRNKRASSPSKKRQVESRKSEVNTSSKEEEVFNSAEVERIRAIADTRRGRRAHSVGQHDEARVEADLLEYQKKKSRMQHQMQHGDRNDAARGWSAHQHHPHYLDRNERPLPALVKR